MKKILMLIIVILLFSGCATVKEKKSKEELLRESVNYYWNIRLKGELQKIYNIEDKNFCPSFEDYKVEAALIRKFDIREFNIKEVTIKNNIAKVIVEFSFYMPPVSKPFKQSIIDRWIWKDRKWWHIFNKK